MKAEKKMSKTKMVKRKSYKKKKKQKIAKTKIVIFFYESSAENGKNKNGVDIIL